ncbi:MAG: hypothetical protein HYS04_15310 [Acidobacteria bacterium]|nr:hypothetical protein [Acidobacteriota bacterium]
MPAEWFKDSKGHYHYVITQVGTMGCALASAAMVHSFYKQMCMVDPYGKYLKLSQNYPGKWTPTGGATMSNIRSVLSALNVKTYGPVEAQPWGVWNWLWSYARETTPAIVGIRWGNNTRHMVVAARVYSDKSVIFYDPFYGVVEEKGFMLPSYVPTLGVSGTLDGLVIITYR